MKGSVTAGAAVGMATSAWMFAEYALGLHIDPTGPGRWTGFISLIFPVAASIWLVRSLRPMSWRAALREGAIFGGVSGLVNGAAVLFYFEVLNPGFMIDGRPINGLSQALTGVAGSLFVGVVLTVMARAILGRKGYRNA